MTKLPDLPSDLIELALKDLEAVEDKSGEYKVDMVRWHDPFCLEDPLCAVCFAGAVISQTCKADINMKVKPENFDPDTERKLLALDLFREGWINSGINKMELTCDYFFTETPYCVTPYSDDPIQFKRDLKVIISVLRKEGL